MLPDDDPFGCLGIPTQEETLRQHCHLLEQEIDDLREQLSRAQANITKLVDINAEVNGDLARTRADLKRRLGQLSEANLELSQIKNTVRSAGIFENAYKSLPDKVERKES